MKLIEVSLKNPVQQAIRLTNDNIVEVTESLNGTLEEGVLSFTLSKHKHFAIAGDWLVLFDGGIDALVFSDKMFQRIYSGIG